MESTRCNSSRCSTNSGRQIFVWFLLATICSLLFSPVVVVGLSSPVVKTKPPRRNDAVLPRRSMLLSSGLLIASTCMPSLVANADGTAPAAAAPKPAPAPPPAAAAPAPPKPAPPKDPIKEMAEKDAKKRIDEEIAKEAEKLKEQFNRAALAEYKQDLIVKEKTKEQGIAESRYKAVKEAGKEVEKLKSKLTGDREALSIVEEYQRRERKQESTLQKIVKEKELAQSRLNDLKKCRFELAAMYRLKTGKELALPPKPSVTPSKTSSKKTSTTKKVISTSDNSVITGFWYLLGISSLAGCAVAYQNNNFDYGAGRYDGDYNNGMNSNGMNNGPIDPQSSYQDNRQQLSNMRGGNNRDDYWG